MKFRYTFPGESPLPPQSQPQPPPPPLSGGYGNPVFPLGNDYFSQGIGCASEYFGPGIGRVSENFQILSRVHPEIQRELEKERIRDEIIAAEVARRQVLEAEVREELRMERELALRLRGGNAFDRFLVPVGAGVSMEPRGISFLQETRGLPLGARVAMNAEERLRIQARCETQGFDMVPFQQKGVESKFIKAAPSPSESGNQKEKIVFLAKPFATLSGTKRKLESPAKESTKKFSGIGNKKGKKEWICMICQVNATSELALSDHFQGKKHKSKEAALASDRNGCNIGFAVLPKTTEKPTTEFTRVSSPLQGQKVVGEVLQINQSEPSSVHVVSTKCLDENNVSMLPDNEKKAKGKIKKKMYVGVQRAPKHKEMKNFTFWCPTCQVGAYSEKAMEGHRMGKKHSKLLQIVGTQGASGANEATKEGDSKSSDNDDRTTIEEHVQDKYVNGNMAGRGGL